ncbi:MAG TPA: hypothetical protein VGU71_10240 [Candidatus Dormibacteraeota bacterium]|nr:hypothetical protein [Candidatus Dormibacteraeota bacterium]
MKRLVLSVAIAVAALLASQGAAMAETTTGAANLHQFHGSGVSGTMSYMDTGNAASGLMVDGTAQGLTPGQAYLSLFYDNGSKVAGQDPCSPSARDNISFPQMFIGPWKVNPDGTGSLHVVKTGASYVPLDMVHTQSIRHVIHFPPMSEADAPVVACGEVHDVA